MCHHYQCVSVRTSSEKIFQKQGKKQQTRNDCCQHFYDRVKVCFLRYFFLSLSCRLFVIAKLTSCCYIATVIHCDMNIGRQSLVNFIQNVKNLDE